MFTKAVFVLLTVTASVHAGLYLSLETVNELPAKWRGFLPDHRRLRSLARPALDTSRSASLTHSTYTDALLKLESRSRTADEAADLGALHLRLGATQKAIGVLREARVRHPDHFALAANLGTAWQIAGDLDAALASLDDAVRLAPPKWKPAEEAHRKLVQLRQREKSPDDLDALFDADDPKALALAQQLALWLPADGRLLWQLGELAHASGDVRTAANILDGCVSEFAMKSTTLRAHRKQYRQAADALEARNQHAQPDDALFKSARPLGRLFDEKQLPAIDVNGVNSLPWLALTETTIARPFKPQFLKYLQKLDGKRVTLLGHMRPHGNEKGGEVTSFLFTEYPVGCWFCEVPDAMSLVFVELADGAAITRNAIRVEGVLKLNASDPEAYLFRIEDAKVKVAD